MYFSPTTENEPKLGYRSNVYLIDKKSNIEKEKMTRNELFSMLFFKQYNLNEKGCLVENFQKREVTKKRSNKKEVVM